MLGITQGLTVFTSQTFLPPLADVRKADPALDPEFVADLRLGELAAASLVLGMGAIAATLVERAGPLIVSAVVAAGMVGLYEWTLAGRRFS